MRRPPLPALAASLLLMGPACVSMTGKAAGAAAEEATQPIVDESIAAFADPKNRRQVAELLGSQDLRRATANLTAGALDGMMMSLSSRQSVESVAPELGLLTREIARQITLGVDDALAEVSIRPAPQTGIGRILASTESATTSSSWMLPLATVVAIAALVVAAVLFFRVRTRASSEREEAARLERATLLLAATMRDAEEQPWGAELRELLRRRAGADQKLLDEVLRDGGSPRH